MKILAGLIVLATAAFRVGAVSAQTPTPAPAAAPSPGSDTRTIRLWEGAAPGAVGAEDPDIPTLTLYPARQPNGTVVIVAPGGGYGALAMNHEGRQVANWLNAMGVTAFVLKYRLGPRYRHPIMIGDAQRAIRLVRARASEFGIAPDRVGLMGFSAGGHLASTAGTRFDAGSASAQDPVDRLGSRPDFLILGYPVISMISSATHAGSVRNLLGENPSEEQLRELSGELNVTAETPPTFLFHTTTDTGVPPENSILFYRALVQHGVPAEMHLFATGPHGVGLALSDPALSYWPTLLANWMRGRGLLTPRPAN